MTLLVRDHVAGRHALRGDRLRVAGTLLPMQGPLNPGEPDFAQLGRGRRCRSLLLCDHVAAVRRVRCASEWSLLRQLGRARLVAEERLDRYVGPPNLEIHGHPVQGRSGGGLFSADGHLIGICNAADLQEDRGIFAGLATIYLELKEIGQERIYLQQQGEPRLPIDPGPQIQLAGPTVPVDAPTAGTSSVSGGDDMEVICIVRSRHAPDQQQRVMVVDRPSAELLARIRREPETGVDQHGPSRATQPIVRAQGN